MKKLMLFGVISIGLATALVHAGNQYNWGTTLGGAWITPDNSTVANNQILQISGSTNTPAIVANTTVTYVGGPVLYGITIAQITALTPSATGQLIFCKDCAITNVCVSTGIGQGAWVAISSNTNKGICS